MYVKQLVIDGFKSYAQRTVLDDFDPKFNAITGMNGSGKSNILDAICYVLGLTNLGRARVASYQQLVYKNGRAGITKASVSIIFDNREKSQSPSGYEVYDEITVTRQMVVGGRIKYSINGVNVQNNRVFSLFESVNLNIDSPHFLIMQGRVTKVLNMKPKEVLATVEEAIGTRLYETSRNEALRGIETKDKELKEIGMVIEESVRPKYERVKKNRSCYFEYQNMQVEVQSLTRLATAHQYMMEKEALLKSNDVIAELKKSVETLKEQIGEDEQRMAQLQKEIDLIHTTKNQQATMEVDAKEKTLKAKQKEYAVCHSAVENQRSMIQDEQRKKHELKSSVEEDTALIDSRKREFQKLQLSIAGKVEEAERDRVALELARKRVAALSVGMVVDKSGERVSLKKQLMDTRKAISGIEIENARINTKLTTLNTGIKKQKESLDKRKKAEYDSISSKIETLKVEVNHLQKDMEKMNYNQNVEQQLVSVKNLLKKEFYCLRSYVQDAESRTRVRFTYADPEPNFDRSRVKGVVADLIQLKDPKFATAVETAAGGGLYNVVIDTAETGKLLLKKGQLEHRVTLIPLNKILSSVIPKRVIERGKSLVGDSNCELALNLINYDATLTKAMEYVFGHSLVCDNMDNAKKVAFDGVVMKRTVTYGGEVFDPEGTVSGGSRENATPVLIQLFELKKKRQQLQKTEAKLKEVEEEQARVATAFSSWQAANAKWQLKKKELEIEERKLQLTPYHIAMSEIREFEKSIEQLKTTLKNNLESKAKEDKRALELEKHIKEGSSYMNKELKRAEEELAVAINRADLSEKCVSTDKQNLCVMEMEIANLEGSVSRTKEEMLQVEKNICDFEKELDSCNGKLAAAKAAMNEASQEVEKTKQVMKALNKELTSFCVQQDAITKDKKEKELQICQYDHDIKKTQNDVEEASKRVENYRLRFPWLLKEEALFGKPGTEFDFSAKNMQEIASRIERLQQLLTNLERHLDSKSMEGFGKLHDEYTSLVKKKHQLENDRRKLEKCIKSLDAKRIVALEEACKKISEDFGSIFSMLLPGARARLERINDTKFEGLEIRVAIGEVWKEAMSELSGGQRSLVALSLILAILRYNPAPLYILDEVDAALDLSHTQNIGRMISEKFKQSQFIIVSLKDGMFNNANVLYQTRFENGTSKVARLSPRRKNNTIDD